MSNNLFRIAEGGLVIEVSKRKQPQGWYAELGCIAPVNYSLINPNGSNYVFVFGSDQDVSTNFFLYDLNGYAYGVTVQGGAGQEQMVVITDGYAPGVLRILPFPLQPTDLTFAVFSPDGYFRLFNINDHDAAHDWYHAIDAGNSQYRVEDPAGVIVGTSVVPPSVPSISNQGNNYKFADGLFYLWDSVFSIWRIPYISADSNHKNARLILA